MSNRTTAWTKIVACSHLSWKCDLDLREWGMCFFEQNTILKCQKRLPIYMEIYSCKSEYGLETKKTKCTHRQIVIFQYAPTFFGA